MKNLRNDLCLPKCVLDVAVSIAASVIVSLLLLSGDIEQNPGPLGGIILFRWYNGRTGVYSLRSASIVTVCGNYNDCQTVHITSRIYIRKACSSSIAI